MMKFKSITYSLLFLAQVSFAQEETQVPQNLNLEKAIEIALVNNFDLKTAKNTLEQAKNQNTIGNAGLLPSVFGGFSKRNSQLVFELMGHIAFPLHVTADGAA